MYECDISHFDNKSDMIIIELFHELSHEHEIAFVEEFEYLDVIELVIYGCQNWNEAHLRCEADPGKGDFMFVREFVKESVYLNVYVSVIWMSE